MRKLIFERLLLHRFGSGTSQRTFFERAVSPSRSGATRLDGTVRIKMESVQNACRVDFYFKFPSVLEQYGDPAKMRGALCSFPYFQKSARRAAFYRKSAVPKEARFPQQRNRSGMGQPLCGRLHLRLRKETFPHGTPFHRPSSSIYSMAEPNESEAAR
jgi:hypothetical protein